MHRLLLALACLFGAVGFAHGVPWQDAPNYLEASQVFQLDGVREQGSHYRAAGHIADGYYVYRRSLRGDDANGKPIDLQLPAGIQHRDDTFGESEIYTGDRLRLTIPAQTPGPIMLHWQGCARAGLCYPPQTIKLTLPGSGASGITTASTASTESDGGAVDLADDQVAAQRLAALGLVAGAALFFGFGVLLAFTPCTLPMIPIVSTMIVGSQAKPRRAFALTLAYVLAMSLTYAAVGVAAGLAGANLQAALQSPWLLGAFAVLFLVLAMSLFGLFELRLPATLMNRIDAAGRQQSGGNLVGAAALGFLSALLVGPCMTAPLAGALLYIGQTGSALTGGSALFAMGLGMGLPLLVIATLGASVLPRPGPWMERVRVVFGFVLVGMAILMLSRFLPGAVSLALWAALGLGVAVGLLGWLHALTLRHRFGWWLAFTALTIGVWSILMLIGAASGGDSSMQPLRHLGEAGAASARNGQIATDYVHVKSVQDVDSRIAEAVALGQWTLIDFYADWCVSCHILERNVFGDPVIAQRLAKMQVLRPDVTRDDAADRALLKHWGVLGPPTLIVIDPGGREARAQRMVGELEARSFISHLDEAGVPL